MTPEATGWSPLEVEGPEGLPPAEYRRVGATVEFRMGPEVAAREARRLARLARLAEVAREVSGRGEILDALSHSARAGVLARAARLENA